VDKRSRARELTIQVLYQLDIQGSEYFSLLDDFLIENEQDDSIRVLASQWSREAWQNVEFCDDLIGKASLKWKLSRLSPVDKSVLRMSVYHLKFCPDIPPKVVINEAVELGKKFSTAQSPGFINGVLDAVMKNIKADSSE